MWNTFYRSLLTAYRLPFTISLSEVPFLMQHCAPHRRSAPDSYHVLDPIQQDLQSRRIVSLGQCVSLLLLWAIPLPAWQRPRLLHMAHLGRPGCGRSCHLLSPQQNPARQNIHHIDPGRPAWKGRIRLEGSKPLLPEVFSLRPRWECF
jgi:hypothetical protein